MKIPKQVNGLDLIAAFMLFLNATHLFVFIATIAGVEPKIVSIFSILFFLFYLTLKSRLALKLALLPEFLLWLVVIVVWPIFSAFLSLRIETREIGIQILLYQILLCSGCLMLKHGRPFLSNLIGLCLLVTLFGLGLSLLFPSFFEAAAANATKPSFYKGRAYGFFLEPNVLAFSVTLLSVGWLSTRDNNKQHIFVYLFSLSILLAIILTGSRSGMATIAIYLILTLISLLRKKRRRNIVFAFGLKAMAISLVLMGTIAIFMLAKYQVARSSTESKGHFDLNDRINSIGTTDLTQDLSLQTRFLMQAEAINKIIDKPFFGYGLEAEQRLKEKGILHGSSHNTILTLGLNYGLTYISILLFAFAYLCFSPGRKRAENQIGINSYFHFVILVFLISQGISVTMESRLVFMVIGIFIVMKHPSFQIRHFPVHAKYSS